MGCNLSREEPPALTEDDTSSHAAHGSSPTLHASKSREFRAQLEDLLAVDEASDGRPTTGPLTAKEYKNRQNATETQSLTFPVTGFSIRYASVSQRGFYPDATDKANQDAACIIPRFGGEPEQAFFAVFDGHGEYGTQCAQFARDKVPDNLLSNPQFLVSPEVAYLRAMVQTNAQLHSQQDIDDAMSGTTAITVLLRGRTLYVANVGDSRCVLAEVSDGKLVAQDMSYDQTPFRRDECERVKRCGAHVLTLDQVEGLKDPNLELWGTEDENDGDPPRLWAPNATYPGTAFTRSIGDSTAERIGVCAEPEVLVKQLNSSHPFLIIASDGVWEFLSSQSVVDMVSKFDDPQEACLSVVAESHRLWLTHETRTDDITMIVIQFQGLKEEAPKMALPTPMGANLDFTTRPTSTTMSRRQKNLQRKLTGQLAPIEPNPASVPPESYARPSALLPVIGSRSGPLSRLSSHRLSHLPMSGLGAAVASVYTEHHHQPGSSTGARTGAGGGNIGGGMGSGGAGGTSLYGNLVYLKQYSGDVTGAGGPVPAGIQKQYSGLTTASGDSVNYYAAAYSQGGGGGGRSSAAAGGAGGAVGAGGMLEAAAPRNSEGRAAAAAAAAAALVTPVPPERLSGRPSGGAGRGSGGMGGASLLGAMNLPSLGFGMSIDPSNPPSVPSTQTSTARNSAHTSANLLGISISAGIAFGNAGGIRSGTTIRSGTEGAYGSGPMQGHAGRSGTVSISGFGSEATLASATGLSSGAVASVGHYGPAATSAATGAGNRSDAAVTDASEPELMAGPGMRTASGAELRSCSARNLRFSSADNTFHSSGDFTLPTPPANGNASNEMVTANVNIVSAMPPAAAAPASVPEEFEGYELPHKDQQLRFLDAAVGSQFMFSWLSAEQRRAVLLLFEHQFVSPGDVIVQQGEPGDTFYIVESGEYEVWVQPNHRSKAGSMSAAEAGFSSGPQVSIGALMSVHGKGLSSQQLAALAGAQHVHTYATMPSAVQALREEPSALDGVGDACSNAQPSPGDWNGTEAGAGAAERLGAMAGVGSADRTGSMSAAPAVSSSSVGSGIACFGQLALLYPKPRAATVLARTDGVLRSLERGVFRQALQQLEVDATGPRPLQDQGQDVSTATSNGTQAASSSHSHARQAFVPTRSSHIPGLLHLPPDTIAAPSSPRAQALAADLPASPAALPGPSPGPGPPLPVLGPGVPVPELRVVVQALRSLEVLQCLGMSTLFRLATVMEQVEYCDGEYVIRQAEEGHDFYLVQAGAVSCSVRKNPDDPNEVPREVLRLCAGQYFGEKALLASAPRAANVVAQGAVTVYQLSRGQLERVLRGTLQDVKDAQRRWRNALAQQREVLLRNSTALGRMVQSCCSLEDVVPCGLLFSTDCAAMMLMEHKESGEVFTVRVTSVADVVALGKQALVLRARDITRSLEPTFFVPGVQYSFKDTHVVAEVLMTNGFCTLDALLQQQPIDESSAACLIASVVLALEHLHWSGVVFRGLSHHTAIVTEAGLVQLVDFRFARRDDGRSYTLCGHPEYLAPELILGRGYNEAVDLWALGVLLHYMLAGDTPFAGAGDELRMYAAIAQHGTKPLQLPPHFSPLASDLIVRLLHPDPDLRLGVGPLGLAALKAHPWFAANCVNWQSFMDSSCSPPLGVRERIYNFEGIPYTHFDPKPSEATDILWTNAF